MNPDGVNPLDTAEAQALREVVRDLLESRSDSTAVRAAMTGPEGFDRDLWSVMCGQIGVAGLAVPEEYGGAGATLAEIHVGLDALGRALTPSPMLGSAALAPQARLTADDDAACERGPTGTAAAESMPAL